MLENVKPFKGCHNLDLTDQNGVYASWTLILADNGVGKTTLLQCIGFMAPTLNVAQPTQILNINESQIETEEAFAVEPAAAPEVATTERYARRGDLRVEMRANFLANCALGHSSKSEKKFSTWIHFNREKGKTEDFEASSLTPAPFEDEPLVLGYGAGRHMQAGNFDLADLPDAIESVFDGASALLHGWTGESVSPGASQVYKVTLTEVRSKTWTSRPAVPLWVISGHQQAVGEWPLSPRRRT